MTRRQTLLFVSPIRPARTGNGLAMRAGLFLEALSRDYHVTLLIIPVAGILNDPSCFAEKYATRIVTLDFDGKLDPLWALCERVTDPEARAKAFVDYPRPALCRFATTPGIDAVRSALAGVDFDAIHVMRVYLAPYVAPFLLGTGQEGRFHASVDLDDDEALTHERFASLLESLGRSSEASVESSEAGKYTQLEAAWLPRFHRVVVCADTHERRISKAYPDLRAAIVANHVALPRILLRWPHRGRRILFVGNLSYLPNVLGLADFIRLGLPRIRAALEHPVTFRIVGGSPVDEVIALAAQAGIELVVNPADLARHYRWADLAIVPVTAGGGTRIKLLEAFAHRVPVVSTTIGAEGIPAVDRVHLRLADSHALFAEACADLLADIGQARRLARQARAFVETEYSRAVGLARIRSLLGPRADVSNRVSPGQP